MVWGFALANGRKGPESEPPQITPASASAVGWFGWMCESVAGRVPLFEELAELGVLAARGFKVEDQVLDRETQVID